MENIETGMVLRKFKGFENAYVCLGLEFIIDKGKTVDVLTGDCALETLPIFKLNVRDEYVVQKVDINSLIKNSVYKDINDAISNFNLKDTYCMFVMEEKEGNMYSLTYQYDIEKRVYNEYYEYNGEFDITDEDFEEKELSLCELNNKVKEAIVGQDSAIKQIASVIVFNQKLIDSDLSDDKIRNLKQTVLVAGPTGTGKTEIIKQIANNLSIPCVIEDSTRYTVEGYKGSSIEDMIKHLVVQSNFDINAAEEGILVIDEIDKKSSNTERGSGVTSTGVQQSLLKILEGTVFNIEADKDYDLDPFDFDSSRLTIIFAGAFSDLEKNKTMNKTMGFLSFEDGFKIKKELEYTTDDFEEAGIIPELMGRISKVVLLNRLDEKDFVRILNESSLSPIKLKKDFYDSQKIKFKYDDEFIDKLAVLAKKKNIGARGLKTAFEELIGDLEYDLLNGDVSSVKFTKDDIKVRKRSNTKSNEK